MRVFRAADLMFGDDLPRVVKVLATQSANLWIAGQHLDVLRDAKLNPWNVKPIATAAYFRHNVPGDAPGAVAKLREAIKRAAQDSARHKKFADGHDFRPIAYEGAQHVQQHQSKPGDVHAVR